MTNVSIERDVTKEIEWAQKYKKHQKRQQDKPLKPPLYKTKCKLSYQLIKRPASLKNTKIKQPFRNKRLAGSKLVNRSALTKEQYDQLLAIPKKLVYDSHGFKTVKRPQCSCSPHVAKLSLPKHHTVIDNLSQFQKILSPWKKENLVRLMAENDNSMTPSQACQYFECLRRKYHTKQRRVKRKEREKEKEKKATKQDLSYYCKLSLAFSIIFSSYLCGNELTHLPTLGKLISTEILKNLKRFRYINKVPTLTPIKTSHKALRQASDNAAAFVIAILRRVDEIQQLNEQKRLKTEGSSTTTEVEEKREKICRQDEEVEEEEEEEEEEEKIEVKEVEEAKEEEDEEEKQKEEVEEESTVSYPSFEEHVEEEEAEKDAAEQEVEIEEVIEREMEEEEKEEEIKTEESLIEGDTGEQQLEEEQKTVEEECVVEEEIVGEPKVIDETEEEIEDEKDTVEEKSVEEESIEEKSIEEKSIEEKSIEEKSIEEKSVEDEKSIEEEKTFEEEEFIEEEKSVEEVKSIEEEKPIQEEEIMEEIEAEEKLKTPIKPSITHKIEFFPHAPDMVCCASLKSWALFVSEVADNAKRWCLWINKVIRDLRYISAIRRGEIFDDYCQQIQFSPTKWRLFIRKLDENIIQWRNYNLHIQQLTNAIIKHYHGKRVVCCHLCTQENIDFATLSCEHLCEQLIEGLKAVQLWRKWLSSMVCDTAIVTSHIGGRALLLEADDSTSQRQSEYSIIELPSDNQPPC